MEWFRKRKRVLVIVAASLLVWYAILLMYEAAGFGVRQYHTEPTPTPMPYMVGERVIADIGGWLVDRGLSEPEVLELPGKVASRDAVTGLVPFPPGAESRQPTINVWTYNVLLDAPITLPGGEQIIEIHGLRRDQLTAEP